MGFMARSADIDMGKAKAGICASCHGADGVGLSPLYANLAGQKAPYLVKQLQNFKAGNRTDPTMNIFAKQLSDEDIENLAAYYESLPAGGKSAEKVEPKQTKPSETEPSKTEKNKK